MMKPYGGWYLPKEKRVEIVPMMGHFPWMLDTFPEAADKIDGFEKIDGVYYLDWMIRRGYARIKYAWTSDYSGIDAKKGQMHEVFKAAIAANPEAGFGPWYLHHYDYRSKQRRDNQTLLADDIDSYIRTGRIRKPRVG